MSSLPLKSEAVDPRTGLNLSHIRTIEDRPTRTPHVMTLPYRVTNEHEKQHEKHANSTTQDLEVDGHHPRKSQCRMSVVCPEVLPGQDLLVEGPDGREILIQVPSGVTAGDEFEVDVSAVDTLVSVSSAQTMTVTVPDGIAGGESLLVETPDGRELEVVVPDGLIAGEEFEFEYE